MGTETTSQRLFTKIGGQVFTTDIDICQRVLPAIIDFKGIEQVVQADEAIGEATLNFEGCESACSFAGNDGCAEARRIAAAKPSSCCT
jgi:hypothetical protein